jgi:hypothetical protein
MKRLVAVIVSLLSLTASEATETRYFVLDTTRALAGATGRGVAIFPDGTLRPIPPLAAVAAFDEPLGLALAVAKDGTAYVGTGHPARLWRVREGRKELLGEASADQITALLLDPGGDLWATTAAPAVLLRWRGATGKPEEVARLAEGNLWDLAWFSGSLVAAAGNPGRLMRLTPKGLEMVSPVPDRHARCLAVSGDALLIGTSGKGFVMRWTGEGAPGVVYDSGFTEIAALAPAPQGIVYAAGITGDPTMGKPPVKEDAEAAVSVTVSESTSSTPQTQKGPATSEIVRILPPGAAVTVHRFTKQIAGTLSWGEDGLVVGTGLEGELWQVLPDGSAAQLDGVDATQVVRVAVGGQWVLTQGPVKLLHRSGPPHGTFASPPLDAGEPAQWGEATLRGELPAVGGCALRFRSGAVAPPDDSWSAWSAPLPCPGGKVSAPPARYLQWQVELQPPPSGAARVGRVVVAYRQINLPPAIKELTVHAPGEIFLKGPPPSDRVVEVQHPELSGIFTTLDDDAKEGQERLGKKYYRVGYQSLSWKAEDPNGDPLRFTLDVQGPDGGRWWKVRDNLDAVVLGIDTQALADGLYRFRLTATDAPANPEAPSTTQALSSWVVVDNTPPKVALSRDGAWWVVTADDALSPIVRVEWNRDAEAWHPLAPEDGLLDRQRETFRVPAEAGHHVLAVRAMDDHYNRATVAVEEKP